MDSSLTHCHPTPFGGMQPKRFVTFKQSCRKRSRQQWEGPNWKNPKGLCLVGRGPCPLQVVQLQNTENNFPPKTWKSHRGSRGCWDFRLERLSHAHGTVTVRSFRLWRRFTGKCSYLSAECVADLENVACGKQLTHWMFHPPACVGAQLHSGVQVNCSPPSCNVVNQVNQVILILIALCLFK